MPGHRYQNMRTSDRAMIQHGNELPAEYRGSVLISHNFSGAEVQWCSGAVVQWCSGAVVQWRKAIPGY